MAVSDPCLLLTVPWVGLRCVNVAFMVLLTYFPIGILGQVWCLIFTIPDLCHCSYLLCKVYLILTSYMCIGDLKAALSSTYCRQILCQI